MGSFQGFLRCAFSSPPGYRPPPLRGAKRRKKVASIQTRGRWFSPPPSEFPELSTLIIFDQPPKVQGLSFDPRRREPIPGGGDGGILCQRGQASHPEQPRRNGCLLVPETDRGKMVRCLPNRCPLLAVTRPDRIFCFFRIFGFGDFSRWMMVENLRTPTGKKNIAVVQFNDYWRYEAETANREGPTCAN